MPRNPDEETRQLLAKALRPFILRRTKEQVAKELPEKTEQTIYCELDATQRKLYNELREHYRQSLLGRIEKEGMAKSKMHILEALLRLRQAACHPGLIDKKRADAAEREVRSADSAADRGAGGRAQGAGVLAIHEPAGASCATDLDAQRHEVRISGRQDAGPPGLRRAFPERSGLQAVSDQPEGGRAGA